MENIITNGGGSLANSTIISDLKQYVTDAISHDDTLFYAFDAKECENGSDLPGTHIFKYNKFPEPVKDTGTYLTVMAHIKARDKDELFITPTLEIWIYSHREHMEMDKNITKDNRNDYLSMLLDKMFNGSSAHGGIGKLNLILNEEGTYNAEFPYRHMIFETIDINDSFCS